MEGVGIFRVCIVISCVVGAIHANRCHPCEGSTAVYTENMDTCDHLVTKESVLFSLKALNHTFSEFRNQKKIEFNVVDLDYQNSPACVQNPLPATLQKSLPKRYKDRFVHETFAKLSYAYDVLEYVTNEFKGPHWRIQNELKIAMCNMVKVNRKIHCRKNRSKPSRRIKSFKATKVCEERDVFEFATSPTKRRLCTLAGLDKVHTVIEDTLAFWDLCVKDSKSGKLVLASGEKCRKREKVGCSQKKNRKQRRRCNRKNNRKQRKLLKNKKKSSLKSQGK